MASRPRFQFGLLSLFAAVAAISILLTSLRNESWGVLLVAPTAAFLTAAWGTVFVTAITRGIRLAVASKSWRPLRSSIGRMTALAWAALFGFAYLQFRFQANLDSSANRALCHWLIGIGAWVGFITGVILISDTRVAGAEKDPGG